MVWIEDLEEFGAADQDHLAHVGGLPARDVVPHPGAACARESTVSQAPDVNTSPWSQHISASPWSHGLVFAFHSGTVGAGEAVGREFTRKRT